MGGRIFSAIAWRTALDKTMILYRILRRYEMIFFIALGLEGGRGNDRSRHHNVGLMVQIKDRNLVTL